MREKLFVIVLFLTIVVSPARAETIYLNDGRVIKGKITNRGAYDVTIKEGAMPRKFFNDQILRIEQDEAPVNAADRAVDPSIPPGWRAYPPKRPLLLLNSSRPAASARACRPISSGSSRSRPRKSRPN